MGLRQNLWVDFVNSRGNGGGTRGPRFLPRTPTAFPCIFQISLNYSGSVPMGCSAE